MKETGILFTPPNHRLILSNQKVQTRRVINPQPREPGILTMGDGNWRVLLKNGMTKVFDWERDCPYGGVGDRLYVKEGIIVDADFNPPELVGYYMDGVRAVTRGEKRLTAMFMAKRYARTWLEITEVRVQRVQDISESDCIAEGIQRQELPDLNGNHFHWGDKTKDRCKTAVEAYRELWDSINKKKHPFSQNTWVWAITFKQINREERNEEHL